MKIKISFGSKCFDAFLYVFMFLTCIVTIYPLIYVISMSLSSFDAVVTQSVWLLPKGFTLESYKAVLQDPEIWNSYYNTLWYTIVGTTLSTLATLMGAYALSRKDFFLRNKITFFMTVTMFFGGGLIPLYIVVNTLGLYNTRWAMILPSLVGVWNIIITRTFFQSTIPTELEESAKLDGCNDLRIFSQIVLPLSGPIIAVLVLFHAVGYWNTWFNALLFLSDKKYTPLQLFLRNILILNQVDPSKQADAKNAMEIFANSLKVKYAVIVVSTLPILCVYPFLQKYFVKGVMIGAIKG